MLSECGVLKCLCAWSIELAQLPTQQHVERVHGRPVVRHSQDSARNDVFTVQDQCFICMRCKHKQSWDRTNCCTKLWDSSKDEFGRGIAQSW